MTRTTRRQAIKILGGATALTVGGAGVGTAHPLADVTFNDQDAKGASVNVASVTLPDGGFVVLHEAGPGAVIGHSQSLDSGTHEDLNVAIKRGKVDKAKRKQDRTLVAMAHKDTGQEGKYEFPEADPPYFDHDNKPIVDTASITF